MNPARAEDQETGQPVVRPVGTAPDNLELYVYDTMSREKERLIPRDPGRLAIYSCGVTPYDDSHLGHARPAVFFDVVRRYLTHHGWQVRYVQNFTDVDDKIIARANQRGEPPLQLAAGYAERYLSVMDALGVRRADAYPKVSEHIDLVIEMVARLVERGHAYVAANGDVYFAVDTFPEYGKLSHQRLDDVMAGARVEAGEMKRSPADFALWKSAKPGEPAWRSPWGAGRPGWHIECSAMSLHYLGNHFDIHGGGLDLIFPHHENEIAQSEAFTGDPPFARHWVHNGLVTTGAEKMSKSLGNFTTVQALLDQYPPTLIRYFLLSVHYRTPLEFSPAALANARRGWQRLLAAWQQVQEREKGIRAQTSAAAPAAAASEAALLTSSGTFGAVAAAATPLGQAVARTRERFEQAMQDDFNTPVALSSLFELARQVNAEAGRSLGSNGASGSTGPIGGEAGQPATLLSPTSQSWLAAAAALRKLGVEILGVLPVEVTDEQIEAGLGEGAPGSTHEIVAGLIDLLLELRQQARARRDWAQADAIRQRLGEYGIVVEDTPQGSRWHRAEPTPAGE